MAIGDAAAAAGMDTVPGTGKVRNGNVEINKTRDYIAEERTGYTRGIGAGGTGAQTKAGARVALGITSGTADPAGGVDGDIYFKII